jgi:hypothetical protein
LASEIAAKSSSGTSSGRLHSIQCSAPGDSTTGPTRAVSGCAIARARNRPSGESSTAAAVEIRSSVDAGRLISDVVVCGSHTPYDTLRGYACAYLARWGMGRSR